jgi:hypothetical protein
MRAGLVGVVVVVVLWCCGVVGSAFGLPVGRAYEMVSPEYKGGFGVLHIEAVSLGGDSVAFYSPGAFAGAPAGLQNLDYVARRGASGWSTSPLMPPADLMPYVVGRDVSPDLGLTLALGKPGSSVEESFQESAVEEFLLHSTSEPDDNSGWGLSEPVMETTTHKPLELEYIGGSADFCHLLVNAISGEILTPEVSGSHAQVYELDRGCDGGLGSLRAVALNSAGRLMSPGCTTALGSGGGATTGMGSALVQVSDFNAVADEGQAVFFSTCVNSKNETSQLFVRLGDSTTLEVSKPVGVACGEPCKELEPERPNADFAGASEDGSKVFFTTSASLISEDKDAGNDLYMATIGCPEGDPGCEVAGRTVTSVTQVSHDPNGVGVPAEVQGVVRVAPDGSRVYFVARGDLLEATRRETLEREGDAVPRAGADNLYFYDSVTGRIGFVTDLCSGHELSGVVDDSRCPSASETDLELWVGGSSSEAQTAGPGGEFLVFSSVGQLTSDDTDSARDIYRYDALTGEINRVSVGEDGFDANGNGESEEGVDADASIALGYRGGSVQRQFELGNRAVSEDGSRIVFTSGEALSGAASNGLVNVYEWYEAPGQSEGSVSLISSGDSSAGVEDAVISPDGDNVFFVTSQGLVPQDVDGAPDVYDAREGGGFPLPEALPEPCAGDACQGPLTNPAPLLIPGSVSQAAGEDYAAAKPVVKGKAKKASGKKKRKGKSSGKKGKGKGRGARVGRRAVRAGSGRGR